MALPWIPAFEAVSQLRNARAQAMGPDCASASSKGGWTAILMAYTIGEVKSPLPPFRKGRKYETYRVYDTASFAGMTNGKPCTSAGFRPKNTQTRTVHHSMQSSALLPPSCSLRPPSSSLRPNLSRSAGRESSYQVALKEVKPPFTKSPLPPFIKGGFQSPILTRMGATWYQSSYKNAPLDNGSGSFRLLEER